MASAPPPADEASDKIRRWLVDHFRGTVLGIARQPRWRPVWFAEVERDGERLSLCVRGDRTDMKLPFPLDHEMRFQSLLQERGIPVAKVYGWIDDPRAFVMDRVPGSEDFGASSADERRAVVDEYLAALARLHALDVAPFAAAGIARAERPEDSGQIGLRRYEAIYRAAKRHPEPFTEFALGWIRRHPGLSRGREAPILWDTGQFHHQGGHLVALLDLEIGHVGDPMMDLAGWRMRDTVIGYGDMRALYARYEELSGRPVDLPAIRLHHTAFALTNQLAFAAALRNPAPPSDLMMNLRWCSETNLFVTEAMAECLDVALPAVEMPVPERSRVATAHDFMVQLMRLLDSDDPALRYQARIGFRLARHLQRYDEIGRAVDAADLDDIAQVLGHRPATWLDAEAELERFVLADAASGRHDAVFVPLFHRLNHRALMLLGPSGSAMASHLPIQRFA